MQIIAGSQKGRKLKAFKNKKIRPTSQKVKAALFNILGQKLAGKKFLDLFAGTGGMGIEALSRGAGEVVFVEESHSLCRIIEENLRRAGFQNGGRIFCFDVLKFLRKGLVRLSDFDFIFLDPPYYSPEGLKVMREIGKDGILGKNQIIIFEHRRQNRLPEAIEKLISIRQNNYGDTVLCFFRVNQ